MIKTLFRLPLWGISALLVFVLLTNIWVVVSGKKHVVDELDQLRPADVALVLGTSKRVPGGSNPFFTYRMDAASELYHSGKVRHIIVSGDNREKYYNEPRDMMEALVALGVPDSCITLDGAGLRTLDSVVRAKEVFGQDEFIVVTQRFHGYRTVFLANSEDIDAQVYVSKTIPLQSSFWVVSREVLARSGAFLDVFLFHSRPGVESTPRKIELN